MKVGGSAAQLDELSSRECYLLPDDATAGGPGTQPGPASGTPIGSSYPHTDDVDFAFDTRTCEVSRSLATFPTEPGERCALVPSEDVPSFDPRLSEHLHRSSEFLPVATAHVRPPTMSTTNCFVEALRTYVVALVAAATTVRRLDEVWSTLPSRVVSRLPKVYVARVVDYQNLILHYPEERTSTLWTRGR